MASIYVLPTISSNNHCLLSSRSCTSTIAPLPYGGIRCMHNIQLFLCSSLISSLKAAVSSEVGRQPSSQKAITDRSAWSRKRGRRAMGKDLPALITIRRSDGNWVDSWVTEQVTSLKELGLNNFALDNAHEKQPQSPDVLVNLKVQKTGWGFFVQGRATSAVSRRCSGCFIEFMREVDVPFQAWLTPSRDPNCHPQGIGEDNDDPTVLHFPPSLDIADLSDVVRDTLHLSLSSKDACSTSCTQIGPRKWQSISEKKMDSSWLPLMAIKPTTEGN